MLTNIKELKKIVKELEQEIDLALEERAAKTLEIKQTYAKKLKELRTQRAKYAKILNNHNAYQKSKLHKNP